MKINNKKQLQTLFLTIAFVNIIQSCNTPEHKEQTATEILSHYYKNKFLDKSIILDERHRIVVDTIVLRLTETKEPESVIQYIVNDYKLKYGTK